MGPAALHAEWGQRHAAFVKSIICISACWTCAVVHHDINEVAPSLKQQVPAKADGHAQQGLKPCWTRLHTASRLCRRCMPGFDHARPEPGGLHHPQQQLHMGPSSTHVQ